MRKYNEEATSTEIILRRTFKDGRDTAVSDEVLTESGTVELLRSFGYEVVPNGSQFGHLQQEVTSLRKQLEDRMELALREAAAAYVQAPTNDGESARLQAAMHMLLVDTARARTAAGTGDTETLYDAVVRLVSENKSMKGREEAAQNAQKGRKELRQGPLVGGFVSEDMPDHAPRKVTRVQFPDIRPQLKESKTSDLEEVKKRLDVIERQLGLGKYIDDV